MSRSVRAWLAGRAGPVPPTLQAAMESAADTDVVAAAARHSAAASDTQSHAPEEPLRGPYRLPRALADAGLRVLADAVDRGDDRAAALALLAADALVTAACEAATDPDVDTGAALDALCDTFAPARLDDLLPEGSH